MSGSDLPATCDETHSNAASERERIARHLITHAGTLTTAVVAAIEEKYPWYAKLGAQERSWINLLASNGINNFAGWFADTSDADMDPSAIFKSAPRRLARTISLRQTVDLVRTTIEVVEYQIGVLIPDPDRKILENAILRYSREVAFASAEIYAGTAESRVRWDERMEALIVDAIIREDRSDELLSRAATLGWNTRAQVAVAVGLANTQGNVRSRLHVGAEDLGLNTMSAHHGDRLVVLLSDGQCPDELSNPVNWVESISEYFAKGTIVVGHMAPDLSQVYSSALSALSGSRVVKGWRDAPRVVGAHELLPERLLAGNDAAREELIDSIYRPLVAAGGDLLDTVLAFLEHSHSIEATARSLYVHPNTVRYRIKRAWEITGYSPSNARQAYTMHLAISLGDLAHLTVPHKI